MFGYRSWKTLCACRLSEFLSEAAIAKKMQFTSSTSARRIQKPSPTYRTESDDWKGPVILLICYFYGLLLFLFFGIVTKLFFILKSKIWIQSKTVESVISDKTELLDCNHNLRTVSKYRAPAER